MNQSFLRPAIVLGASLLATAAFSQTLYTPGGTVGNITGSNVGIGTTTPGQKLDVAGVVRSQGQQLWGGGQLQVQWCNQADPIDQKFAELIAQNSQFTARFVNDAYSLSDTWLWVKRKTGSYITDSVCFPSGTIGIGTVNPTSKVQIYDGTGVGAGLLVQAGYPFGAGVYPSVLKLKDKDNKYELLNVNSDGSFAFNRGPDRVLTGAANGNVGIGTIAPTAKLQIGIANAANVNEGLELARLGGATSKVGLKLKSNAGGYYRGVLEFTPNGGTTGEVLTFGNEATGNIGVGCIGIGTASPSFPLSLGTSIGNKVALYDAGNGTGYGFGIQSSLLQMFCNTAVDRVGIGYGNSSAFVETLTVRGGNVGIGTTNPTNKLEVNGTIRAKEVIVETTGWSDYVFAPEYRLAPLSEVEAHIAANGHLPGIPSAAEVATQGVSVGDMQAKLLAKIEELTLRQIAQEKRLDAQSTQLSAQSTRITQLEAENAALKASK